MINARTELMRHIAGRAPVKYIQLVVNSQVDPDAPPQSIAGRLEEVLPRIDFNYDNGYGGQAIFGTIWYAGGTWSEREEYDGSEWWAYRACPPLPEVPKEPQT